MIGGINQNPLIKGFLQKYPIAALLISAVIFAVIQLLLFIPLLNPGEPLESSWFVTEDGEDRKVNFPWSIDLIEKKTIILKTEIPPVAGKSLVITSMNTTAFTAKLDGRTVSQIGDHENATANLWNAMIVVPLGDSRGQNQELEITMSGHQILAISRPFRIEDSARAARRLAMHRLFYHDMVIFFMGASVLVGVLLISFSTNRHPRRHDGWLLGMSSLIIAIYALDFTFRSSTGAFAVYDILKRIIIASGYLGSFLFLASLDFQSNKRFILSRWMLTPNIICIILIVTAPSVGVMNIRLVWLNGILFINLLMVIYLVIRKMRKRILYVVASGLAILSIIQIILIMTVAPIMPAVLQYLVVFTTMFVGLQFLLDYREVYSDREKLRAVYNKDDLTGAYSRRALDSIHLNEYGSAVFLDFDSFKPYNDKFGHEKGDQLLRDFVRKTGHQLRRDDMIIRYGGDEFLILLKETNGASVRDIVERIRESFRRLDPTGGIDISYGIGTIGPDGELDIEAMDQFMYAMKESKKRS